MVLGSLLAVVGLGVDLGNNNGLLAGKVIGELFPGGGQALAVYNQDRLVSLEQAMDN